MHQFELGTTVVDVYDGQEYKIVRQYSVVNPDHPDVVNNPALGRMYTIEAIEKNNNPIGQRKAMNEVILSNRYYNKSYSSECISKKSMWLDLEEKLQRIDAK